MSNNTTTTTGNSNTSAISNFFTNISNTITNNNTLNYALYNGIGGIPYATFGMVGIVIATLAYATFSDAASELANTVENTVNSVQSSEMFKPLCVRN